MKYVPTCRDIQRFTGGVSIRLEVVGEAGGVPSSRRCLDCFVRMWCNWAGSPKVLKVDRGTHNRGIFMSELEKMGTEVRSVATEAPFQLGRTERHGGILKSMLQRMINAAQVVGEMELQLAVCQAVECKNRWGNCGGFSPAQWVLGRNPRSGGWTDEDEETAVIHDEDPTSTYNRRAALREAARSAWTYEDSHRRIRKALLRKGGAETQRFRQGDLVSFMRRRGGAAKWFGPARVLTTEGKNVWIMHGGVPILTAENMVRPSSSEGYLEKELLGSKKGTKRTRGVIYENLEQRDQVRRGEQPSYLDLRRDPDAGETMEEILGIPGQSTGGLGAPTEKAEEDDESPKRMRNYVREMERQGQEEKRNEDTPAQDVPIPESDYEPSIAPEQREEEGQERSVQEERAPVADLRTAMQHSGGNRLDVGERMSRTMRSTQRNAEIQELVGKDERKDDRSRSPPRGLQKEFTCFMAKRCGKKKGDPASTGELHYEKETEEMREALDQSRGKEWSNWLKYQAVRIPDEAEVERMKAEGMKAIPMKWVDVDKNAKLRTAETPEVDRKLKSRLVLRGDLEPGDYRVDCPTTSTMAAHMVFSFAASGNYDVHAGDITAAFLQGAPIKRKLLMKVPNSGIPQVDGKELALEPGSHLVARMSIYGSRDAPRGFWLALRSGLLEQGLHEAEPALYALRSEQGELLGLAATHVDDVLWTGREELHQAMQRLQERFTFGSVEVNNFRFCGRRVETTADYIEITSPELLGKVKPIRVEGQRNRQPTDPASAEEQSQMRAVLGSIGYVARLCRPELSYKCSSLQGRQSRPTKQDLDNTNKFLAAAQKTSKNGIRFQKGIYEFKDAVILSVTDASHAAELHVSHIGKESGHKSQAGKMILLADRMPSQTHPARVHILEWASHTIKRVCRSTLQAEVLSSMDGSEGAHYIREVLHALTNPKNQAGRLREWRIQAMDSRHVHWVTDCRSYTEYLSGTGTGVVSDKRLAIDLTSLRQELWRPRGSEFGEPSVQETMPGDTTDHLWWICTRDMIADGLTKSMAWNALTDVAKTGYFQLTVAPIAATVHSGS